LTAEPLEGQDLLIDPLRASRARRADHDLARGQPQGLGEHRAEVRRARELLAVAEDRREALRYRPARGDCADQLLGRAVGLERLVQPASPLGIAVALAQER